MKPDKFDSEIYAMPGHLIRRAQQRSTQLFQKRVQAAGYDITPVQFAAMQVLSENPGIDQARLSALIAYDRATIGGVIDRLRQKGLVTRSVSREDRRAREVCLSTQGRALLEVIMPLVQGVQKDIVENLDERETEAFLRLISKVAAGKSD